MFIENYGYLSQFPEFDQISVSEKVLFYHN